MLRNHLYGLFFKEIDLASGRHRQRRRPGSETTFVGGYSYNGDLMLHPRHLPRPAAFVGDWDIRQQDLRLDSAFRREVGVREPLEEFGELDAGLRRVFGTGDGPLRDNSAHGVRYHLLLLVPTPHCGVVGWERPGRTTGWLGYLPAYSDTAHPLTGFPALGEAETLGKFGQLVSDYGDELAESFPSKRAVRLENLDFAARRAALSGLGIFADPLARRLQSVAQQRRTQPENPTSTHRRSLGKLGGRRLRA